MVVAWAHQDCLNPFEQSEQRAEKVRQLRGQVTELERKLKNKEEELKSNEIELVARNKRFERAQAEVGMLKGELAKLHADNKSLQDQLGKAKAAATK